jgi:glycosyltransferase involved in cell wall biosynthesis
MQKLSVNIITYNGATSFINYAIESVIPYAEDILVYDTGSTDNTIELLKDYPVRVFQEDIQHLGETWTNSPKDERLTEILNILKDESSGDYILKIDDDEVFPQPLMREIEKLLKTTTEPVYTIPFLHIGSTKLNYIKRLFKNNNEISWHGIYGTETLAINGKRISSRKCPILENYFIHLGELRDNLGEREHRYENL